ncbi:MAG: GvpL/GvpF family gas vesicle protein [Nitrospirota bacterium]
MEGKYIYGIVEASKEKLFNSGVGVYTIPHQDISAVVSDSPFVDYTALPKDQVARYLLSHQQVIERVMDFYTIIPMRLGTYAFNIEEVKEILSKGYAIFKDVFRNIDNKIEIDVVATWNDLNSVIKEIGEEEEIKEIREELMSKPEGLSIEDKMRIGRRVKEVLDKKREKIAFEMEGALKDVSIDFRKHDLMDDRMILNTAFLIDKDKKTEFERRLDELNELYNGKIDFRCVGPLPTYSFYTAEIKKIRFDEIDWARKRLCLNDVITKDKIEKAYRNQALMCHPDRNPDLLGSDKEFNEVNKAYKLLLEYCLFTEQTGEVEKYSFKEEDVDKNAIVVVKMRE